MVVLLIDLLAATLRDICRFMEAALIPNPDPAARDRGWQPRGKAYRALGDLHGEYQRAMSEPAAVSRRASAWWPAIVALDEVADAATATRVALRRGAPASSPDAVHQLTAALDGEGRVHDDDADGVRHQVTEHDPAPAAARRPCSRLIDVRRRGTYRLMVRPGRAGSSS
jgi:hypothetical protein